jgi:hypothetical protein
MQQLIKTKMYAIEKKKSGLLILNCHARHQKIKKTSLLLPQQMRIVSSCEIINRKQKSKRQQLLNNELSISVPP